MKEIMKLLEKYKWYVLIIVVIVVGYYIFNSLGYFQAPAEIPVNVSENVTENITIPINETPPTVPS